MCNVRNIYFAYYTSVVQAIEYIVEIRALNGKIENWDQNMAISFIP